MIIDFTRLYEIQASLDETIAKNHNISYKTTREERILALLVEIGELANSTRCFKYWSNKPSEEKERVLDEFADGLHFFLSIGIDLGIENKLIEVNFEYKENPTFQFHKIYNSISCLDINRNLENYEKAFKTFLEILPCLDFTWKDAEDAYLKKVDVNYLRQKTNY